MVLGTFAADGLKEKGCERVDKVSKGKRGSGYIQGTCPGKDSTSGCIRRCHAETILLSNSGERIGTAAIFPSLRLLYGKSIPEDKVLIRVGDCMKSSYIYQCDKDFEVDSLCSTSQSRLSDVHLGNFLLWDRACLSRIKLIGELRQDVGTAIYARPMHQYVCVTEAPRTQAAEDISDAEGAVLVFDVVLRLETEDEKSAARDEYYVFSAWYETQAFEKFKSVHFGNRTPPKKRMDITSKNCSLLWNKRKIEQI